MKNKELLVKYITDAPAGYSPYQVFSDFLEITAVSFANACTLQHGEVWEKREQQYTHILEKYGIHSSIFPEMLGVLTMAAEERIEDILGEVYMASGCGNKFTGQFFTPFHVSKLVAELMALRYTAGTVHEPSCGSGGMILAVASVLKEQGIDYRRKMRVIAQDLDWKAVYMCYIQLSLYGIDAIVVQGDSLREPYERGYPEERVFRTPANVRMLL